MKRSTYIWSIIALTILQLPAAHDDGREGSAATKPQAVKAYGQLPLSFEANQGQTDQRVKFLSHGSGYSLFLTGDEAVLALKKPGESTARDRQLKPAVPSAEPPAALRMRLVGANAAAKVTGLAELPGKSNYFIGNDPKKWRTNVPNYAKVRYTSVYPGVDLVYYGNQGQLEYDFVVQPGADPGQIALQLVAPASSQAAATIAALRIDKNGDLVVATEGGEVTFHKPVVYQPGADHGLQTTEVIDGKYLLKGGRVAFEVARYDKTRPLVIDPTLAYSTYLGGSGQDQGNAITFDASGDAYVTGEAFSSDFPTTPGAFKTHPLGNGDVFVTKLNAAGSALIYSTYLGGANGQDGAYGIAVDVSGSAYLTGFTYSTNFPVTRGAFQTKSGGAPDAFVTKLNATGSALVYSTYLGGNNLDIGVAIAIDASGNAYVTGEAQSSNFPTTPGAFQTTNGGAVDAFVSKLNAVGSALVYSTYLGGSDNDGGSSITIDSLGDVYVAGATGPPNVCNPCLDNFPTTPGAFQTTFPAASNALAPAISLPTAGFISKLNPAGSALVYSTYLGGVGVSGAGGIVIDGSGSAYVTGGTTSSNFPTTPGALQTAIGSFPSGFVSKLNATGSALVYSTYLGGSGGGSGQSMAIDASGNAYVTGITFSSGFPVTPDAFQTTFGGGSEDAFFSELNAVGSALVYSTYLGGSGADEGHGIAVDASGNAYVAGFTESTNFPTTPGAFQTTFRAFRNAFVSKFSVSPITLFPSSLNFGAQLINTTSGPKTVTLTNIGDATLDISNIGIVGTSGSFSETNNCGSSVLAGASCAITVTFRPTKTSTCAETGTLTVTDGASSVPQTVKLSGAGTVVSLSEKSLNFGNQPVGTTSAAKTITMSNHSNSRVVSIAAITISGLNSPAFAQTNTCGTSLGAGASCTLSVTFAPHRIGSKTATLNVWNNGGALLQVTLTGNGT